MKAARFRLVAFLLTCAGSLPGVAQIQIGSAGYFQDFNTLSDGLPESWSVHTGATATSLGASGASFLATPQTWGSTGGAFKNFASSTGLTSSDSTGAQSGSSDRALGIRQTDSFGDSGAAFVFNFSSTGTTLAAIELDLLMLSVQARSTTWRIDYGIGAAPTSFTVLDTWIDPGVFGTTRITLSEDLAELSNQPDVWLRIAALEISTGGGTRDSIGIDNFSITAIPEPGTYAAMCGATVLFAAFLRRAHQRRNAGRSRMA